MAQYFIGDISQLPETVMSIYISYHPLDYDFAYELLTFVHNSGFDAKLYPTNCYDNLSQHVNQSDALIVLLRPEYLQLQAYLAVVSVLDNIADFFPVLRFPISVTEWPSNVVFSPIADFTSHASDVLQANLSVLQAALQSSHQNSMDISARESYLNNLSLVMQTYIRPLVLLEQVNHNYGSNETPLTYFLNTSPFKIGKLNDNGEAFETYRWTERDNLTGVMEHHRSFTIACEHIDRTAIAFYLVEGALQRAKLDSNAPTPLFLDVEHWPKDISWVDWIKSQVAEPSDTLSKDISNGGYIVFAYGLDYSYFRNHPFQNSFYEWLNSASPSLRFISICTRQNNCDSLRACDIVVAPTNTTIEQLQDVCSHYSGRLFPQFISSSANKKSVPIFDYLTLNPIFAIMLLSLEFDTDTDFHRTTVADYYEIFIQNLWSIATWHSHDETDFNDIEHLLLRSAAIATEQQKINLDYNLVSTHPAITKCIDASLIAVNRNNFRFSMPTIQDYFAALALVKFGFPAKLPTLSLDKQFHRIPQKWDASLIISSHIYVDNESAVRQIAKFDSLLALLCVVSGASASQILYSDIVEQNLSSLAALGDFRVSFAKILYRRDATAAKEILIETLRNANWQIRLDAFAAFVEMDAEILPGLGEAIKELSDHTRYHVIQGLHSLGTKSLATLYQLLRKDNATVRANAAWALGQLGDKASTPALLGILHDNNLRVSKQVVASLGLLKDVNCILYLIQYFRIRRMGIRREIITVVTDLYTALPEQFLLTAQKMDVADKLACLQIASHSTNTKWVDLLLDFSFDDNVDVRSTAIQELALHTEARVISRLEDCLDDMTKSRLNKATVNEIASKILANIHKTALPEAAPANEILSNDDSRPQTSSEIGKARLLKTKEARLKEQDLNPDHIATLDEDEKGKTQLKSNPKAGDDNYVSSILEQLRERKWADSSNAAKTLQEYIKNLHGNASLQVINQILETLNDNDWVIRWTGVETLGWTGNVYVVPHLVQRLTDSNWKVRIAAIRSLAEIGDHYAVAGLSALVSDKNAVVREAAAEALGTLNGKDALQSLEVAAADSEELVRLAAIESIGKIRQPAAAPLLLSALKDKSQHVRWAAANGIAFIATANMVPDLIQSLSDTGGPYWEQKRICDVIVDILKQLGTDEALKALASHSKSQV